MRNTLQEEHAAPDQDNAGCNCESHAKIEAKIGVDNYCFTMRNTLRRRSSRITTAPAEDNEGCNCESHAQTYLTARAGGERQIWPGRELRFTRDMPDDFRRGTRTTW